MPDGSIIINTSLDNKQLERELSKLKKDIGKLGESISGQESKKSPLVQQANELEQKMKSARAEVERYRAAWTAGVSGADKEQSAAVVRAQQLEVEHAKVVAQIDKIDTKLQPAYEKMDAIKVQAGGVAQELAKSGVNSEHMGRALQHAGKSLDRFKMRLKEVVRSALIFTLITQSLAQFRNWMGKVIKSNEEASVAVARLKGALLTLAQPLLNIILPAFTMFVNVLTSIITKISALVSALFGTTLDASKAAAESLNDQTDALDGTGAAAKKAGKSLAGFDEVNKISGEGAAGGGGSGASEMKPDFSGLDDNWLEDTLGKAAGWVTAALLLGGIALIAIGASTGNFLMVVAGFAALGAGIDVGTTTGVLQSWVDALGLSSVPAFVTAALLLGGIALIAIGAMTANFLMIVAGLGLLGGGVYTGMQSGTLASWTEALGLESVFDYVVVAIQLAGIALVAIGAAMGNIAMVVAGAIILGAGLTAEVVGEETLKEWWEVLKLTSIQQWVSVALLLVGIALIAIGAAMGNILMVLAGAGVLALGIIDGAKDENLKDWVSVLGLEKVAGWVTAALLLAGIGLIVFGIVTANILMVIAGLGLLGAGVSVGITSGTFSGWIDMIVGGLKSGWTAIKGWWDANIAKIFTTEFWKGLGRDMLDGLFNGLSAIGSKISEWGSGFISGVKDFFGIHSPSTEFESLGGYMMAGLQNGVTDNASTTETAFSTMFAAIVTIEENALGVMQASLVLFIAYLSGDFAAAWKLVWQMCYGETSINIHKVISEIDLLNARLASIERNIVITITTVHETVSGGASGSSGSGGARSTGPQLRSFALPEIPRLARGAVIPPNREFMAVLGDQKSGTNIEAPEALIRRIVREETAGRGGGGGDHTVILEVDKQQLGKVVYRLNKAESRRIGLNLVEV